MKNAFLWFVVLAFFISAAAKSEYFSDETEEEFKKLQQIERFLRQRVEEAEAGEDTSNFGELDSDSDSEAQIQSSKKEYYPPFEYKLPTVNPENEDSQPFAVGPFDPRYYQDFGRLDEPPSEKEKRPDTEISKDELSDEISTEDYNVLHSYIRQIPMNTVTEDDEKADIYFTAVVAGCSAAAVVAIIAIGIGCYRLQKSTKAAADVDYPAYGVTGPNKDVSPTSGDRRLAQSAQMYHYQHQKQQIIAMESMNNKERRSSVSDAESEEENEEGDYTVYECPGLASTGEMEVKNPLFQDDQTPASKPIENSNEESRELPKFVISFKPNFIRWKPPHRVFLYPETSRMVLPKTE